jgi:peptidoglycan/xylan/chitin deacetylase (PgdA/CDA1 family)
MEKKELKAYVLVSLLFVSLAATSTMSSIHHVAIASSDEDGEEQQTEEEQTSTTPEQPVSVQPLLPQPEQRQAQQQQNTTFANPPTSEDLIAKYGAGRTLPANIAQSSINGTKAVVLTFDDNWLSQYEYAEPILRNNNFSGTFFIYCLGIGQGPAFMNPDQVRDLHAKGYDLQSHSMTHRDLTHLNAKDLQFEVATSKDCLQDMVPGAKVTGFAAPFAAGGDNATILKAIQDAGYQWGRVGYGSSFDLACNGYYVPENQTKGCEMYGTGANATVLKVQSRWNIPTEDVNGISRESNYNLNKTQADFIAELEDGLTFDGEGNIKALPVLVYHNFSNRVLPPDQMGQSLLAESFAQEMQYLKANDYTVLAMSDLVYDPASQSFTIPKLGSE